MASKRANSTRSKRKRRIHGFRKRMASPGGKNVIKRRRKKGRKQLTVKVRKYKGVS